MVNCVQFCFNFAYNFNLRRYAMMTPLAEAALAGKLQSIAALVRNGGAVQVEVLSIKTRVETAYGVCNQRWKL